MASKKTSTGAVAAEIGAGIAAAAGAAAAGYYFYASKDAKKHRKIAAKWANDLKKDVVKQAKKVGDMSAKDYAKAVDAAAATYASMRGIDSKDVRRAADELKKNWEMVKKEARVVAKKVAPAAKKAAKKAKSVVKKVAKKAPKKAAKKRK